MKENTNTTKKIISHAARVNKMTQAAIRAALGAAYGQTTKRDAVKSIRDATGRRGNPITYAAARGRLDAAAPVARKIAADLRRGDDRRHAAAIPAARTTKERKTAQITAILSEATPGRYLGGRYSGQTSWVIGSGPPAAKTVTNGGDQYSRRCTYRRTDALHYISTTVSALGRVRDAKVPVYLARDELIVLDVIETTTYQGRGIHEAVVVRQKGKKLTTAAVFVADQGDGQYHVATSPRAAKMAITRAAETDTAQHAGRVTPSILRHHKGWCSKGIANWLTSHGVTRLTRRRLRRGTSYAALARLIQKHGGPADVYDRELVRSNGGENGQN